MLYIYDIMYKIVALINIRSGVATYKRPCDRYRSLTEDPGMTEKLPIDNEEDVRKNHYKNEAGE